MSKLKPPKKTITLAEVLKLVTVVKRCGKWCIKDVKSNVCGDVAGWIDGDVGGDVCGDVVGTVCGDVGGDVMGDVCYDVRGDVGGTVYGDVKNYTQTYVFAKPKPVTKKRSK